MFLKSVQKRFEGIKRVKLDIKIDALTDSKVQVLLEQHLSDICSSFGSDDEDLNSVFMSLAI